MTWARGIDDLSQALALSGLPAIVQGSDDEPPATPGEQPAWIDRWTSRARTAVEQAWRLVQSTDDAMRKRGRTIGRLVARGGRAVWRVATAPARAAARGLREVVRAADHVARAWLTTNTIIIIGGAVVAYLYFSRKHQRR